MQAHDWNQYPPGTRPNPFTLYPRAWVFAGRPCSCREFADFIWPEDSPEKTAFLLRWNDFKL